jgi:hypothetical protein
LQLLERKPQSRMEQDRRQIEDFYQRLKKGKFIWPLTEDELRYNLSPAYMEDTGMEFCGRILESKNKKDLVWGTYARPYNFAEHASTKRRKSIEKKQRSTVETYLTTGVTGAKMLYDDTEPRDRLMTDANKVVLFGDIRNMFGRMASARFGALMFDEMQSHPSNQYITAYRLWDVFVDPPLDLMQQTRDMGLLPNHNDRSEDLFRQFGFNHFAIDFNRRGETSKRYTGGRLTPQSPEEHPKYQLLPKWGVLFAMVANAAHNARSSWQKWQRSNADFSKDAVPSHLLRRISGQDS